MSEPPSDDRNGQPTDASLKRAMVDSARDMRAIAKELANSNRAHEIEIRKIIRGEADRLLRAVQISEIAAKRSLAALSDEANRLVTALKSPLPGGPAWIPLILRRKAHVAKNVAKVASTLFFNAVAILALYLSVTPKLDVAIGETYLKNDPFAAAFSVKNDGILELYHVRVTCRIIDAASSNLEVSGYSATDLPKPAYHNLPPSARVTNGNYQENSNFCPYGLAKDRAIQLGGPTYKMIGLAIVVEYERIYWPFCSSQEFFFKTEQTSEGHLVWEQQVSVPDLAVDSITQSERDLDKQLGLPDPDAPSCSNYQ